jgi:hypothetical protein
MKINIDQFVREKYEYNLERSVRNIGKCTGTEKFSFKWKCKGPSDLGFSHALVRKHFILKTYCFTFSNNIAKFSNRSVRNCSRYAKLMSQYPSNYQKL